MKRILSIILMLTTILSLLTGTALAGSSPDTEKTEGFADIGENDWFYSDVIQAASYGLISGMPDGLFHADDHITYAQTVKLAACLHQMKTQGAITLTNGDPWYASYRDYAGANGIETCSMLETSEWATCAVERIDFVRILHSAISEADYPAINSIADHSIPDFQLLAEEDGDYGKCVYDFYRAGILTGSDGGYFYPDSFVKRSEVAAILNRIVDPSVRKSTAITVPAEDYWISRSNWLGWAQGEIIAVACLGETASAQPDAEAGDVWADGLYCCDRSADETPVYDLGGTDVFFVLARPGLGGFTLLDRGQPAATGLSTAFIRCTMEETSVSINGEVFPLGTDWNLGEGSYQMQPDSHLRDMTDYFDIYDWTEASNAAGSEDNYTTGLYANE